MLTADYDTICKRNETRNHILNGVWIDETTIKMQRDVLEKMIREVVGTGNDKMKKEIVDTTSLSKKDVIKEFNEKVDIDVMQI